MGFRCLKGRHMQVSCRGKPCKTCQGEHHRLLRQERTTREGHERSAQMTAVVTEHAATSVNNVNVMHPYLKIVPFELYGPKGWQIESKRRDVAKRYVSQVSVATK
ncbi:hypothetical protein EVAR_24789_1 [Eumeta japonica]|uniref:Uncharacterized protein n=1 Tax=Eumeta variegata TaxID=151549 RepID=A0A4C1W032_EUMVA|nr:hypothetical protein EVAR_24789_1 [Eumeta japonica]